MALDFIDSCAHGGSGISAISVASKWTNANSASYSTVNVRTSGISIAIVGSINKSLTYVSERYMGGAYFYPTSSTSGNLLGFLSGGIQVAFITVNSDLSITINAGTGVPIWNSGVSSSLYLTGNVFHYFEFHVIMGGGSPITVTCDLIVDGQAWVTGVSGNANYNSTALLCQSAEMNGIFFGAPNGGGDTGWVCDIYALNTDTNDINGNHTDLTSFLGDIAVNALIAVADVTTQMNNVGTTPPVYPLIAEIPPDNDTTYIYDNTVGHLDTFNFQPLVGFAGQILGAQLLIYARKDAEGARAIQGLVGGVAQRSLYGNQDFLYDYYDYHIFPLDSDNGVPWTPSVYNVENFGVKLSA